ncbi:MAG TPA: toxin-antitoxin system HicB family antitoxin [Candidatus Limihabitans stercoravium]|nr:toxin-antitoxin system HicB family antitoxin [Candidatus Limihabitans stercoravium]
MNNYEIRVTPHLDSEGNTYWTAFYPAVDGCVGGGATVEEAITEASENLKIFLAYLKKEKREVPKPYSEPQYSGKIALRIPKSTHRKVVMLANEEQVSVNTLLISAIERYLGNKEFDSQLDKKIEELSDWTNKYLRIQLLNSYSNFSSQGWANSGTKIAIGGDNE